jgi:hypothetical protein
VTAAAARVRGFATAVKGWFGWRATCTTCEWSSTINAFAYKGDAASAAREHNTELHQGASR